MPLSAPFARRTSSTLGESWSLTAGASLRCLLTWARNTTGLGPKVNGLLGNREVPWLGAPVDFFGQVLPAVNASLNATSATLLFLAVRAVRARDVARHRRLMLAAVTVSAVFLVGYIVSFVVGPHTRYPAHDWTRGVYFAILISHELLAPFVVPLVLRMVYLGVKNRVADHKRLARFALPVWAYISVTGVLIYFFSRHIGPWRAG